MLPVFCADEPMKTKDIIINAPNGLHLRVAARLVNQSREIQSKVRILKGSTQASLNSIFDLLFLAAERGAEVRIVAEGADEDQAVEDVSQILMDGAGI